MSDFLLLKYNFAKCCSFTSICEIHRFEHVVTRVNFQRDIYFIRIYLT
jgi:hypothetical protein